MIKSGYKIVKCILLGSLFLVNFFSCDYLDVIPDNVATIDYAFVDRASAERYLHTCYWYLPRHGHVTHDPAMLGGGELNSYTGGAASIARDNYKPILGTMTPTGVSGNYWDGFSTETAMFMAIRDCNIFLENIDRPYDIMESERKRWIAEVKFLKAYYHFFLLRLYGAIPIVDTNVEVSSSTEELMVYREPFDDCVQYISDLLDEAIADLPETIVKEATELGRITQPIAKAIKAKLWITAASPLFNGNTDYRSVVDNRGKNLFSAEYDPQKWQKAADACIAAIESAHSAGAELYKPAIIPFPLNDRLDLQFGLRQIIWEKWNKELIWGTNKTDVTLLQKYCLPKLQSSWRASVQEIASWLNPTQDLVETYYTKNGVPMNEDLNYSFEDRYLMSVAGEEEAWYIEQDYKTAYLHFDREPRFYANIGFDGGVWWGNGRTSLDEELYVTKCKFNQVSGLQTWQYFSITGYYSKKLVAYETVVPNNTGASPTVDATCPFPVVRLADLYLYYAEALNELNETPDDKVYEYIDKVRERAGLKGVVESWSKFSKFPDKPASKEGMRSIIQQERLIEMAMEGHWMYDIRRWKRGIEFWNKDWVAWNIWGETEDEFYTFISTGDRQQYYSKNYLWPILQDNLYKNTNLVQNYGW